MQAKRPAFGIWPHAEKRNSALANTVTSKTRRPHVHPGAAELRATWRRRGHGRLAKDSVIVPMWVRVVAGPTRNHPSRDCG